MAHDHGAGVLRAAQGAVEIHVGDCRATLAALPEAAVDCIVTSPPYYGLRSYGCDGQIGLEQTPAAYLAEIVGVMRACRRVLKPGGTLWLNIGDSYAVNGSRKLGRNDGDENYRARTCGREGEAHDYAAKQSNAKTTIQSGCKHKDLLLIPAQVAIALRADGWWLRSEIIWHKPNPMPESVRDRPTKAHEQVFMLSNAERYFYDKDAIAEQASYPGNLGFLRGKSGVNLVDGVSWHTPSIKKRQDAGVDSRTAGGDTRNARTVWTIATESCDLAHFALMPTELARRCILAGCPNGGVVLDPFGGGGTTGLVAARHGRSAILCELNPEYAEMARARIAREWKEPERPATVDMGPLFGSLAAE